MLRGVKCNICGEIGTHYSSSCSERVNVGVPVGLRATQPQQAHQQESAAAEMPAGGPAVFEKEDEEEAIDPTQLEALIRKRPDLPTFLRCRACLALPAEAIWCQCCDIFVCQACLGPPPDATWACPECEQDAVDNFHGIRAMREVITAWFQAVAVLTDPYCASTSSGSDDEGHGEHEEHECHHILKKRRPVV